MPLELSQHLTGADFTDGGGFGFALFANPLPADAVIIGADVKVTTPFAPGTTMDLLGTGGMPVDAITERTIGGTINPYEFSTDPFLRVQTTPFDATGVVDIILLYFTLSGATFDPGVGYCAIDDVKREMGRYGPNLTGTSTPSTTDATTMIAVIAREIDGVLAAKGIATPVTVPPNPATIAPWIDGFLLRLNALGAAGAVLQGMFPHAQGPASSNLGPDKTAEYRTILGQMRKDFTLIPDALLLDTTLRSPSSGRSLWTDGVVDADDPSRVDPEQGPIFTRSTQW